MSSTNRLFGRKSRTIAFTVVTLTLIASTGFAGEPQKAPRKDSPQKSLATPLMKSAFGAATVTGEDLLTIKLENLRHDARFKAKVTSMILDKNAEKEEAIRRELSENRLSQKWTEGKLAIRQSDLAEQRKVIALSDYQSRMQAVDGARQIRKEVGDLESKLASLRNEAEVISGRSRAAGLNLTLENALSKSRNYLLLESGAAALLAVDALTGMYSTYQGKGFVPLTTQALETVFGGSQDKSLGQSSMQSTSPQTTASGVGGLH